MNPKRASAAAAANESRQPRTQLGRRRRARLLDIAEREFLDKGYVRASLNAIVARAGGSKSSISQYFHNKAGLFAAVVENRVASLVHVLERHSDEGDCRELLQRLGELILNYMLRKECLMARRGLYAQGAFQPEITHVFFDIGHAPIVSHMTRLFNKWRLEGRMRLEDTAGAASLFIHMLSAGILDQTLVGLRRSHSSAEMQAEVAAVVDVFLRGAEVARPVASTRI